MTALTTTQIRDWAQTSRLLWSIAGSIVGALLVVFTTAATATRTYDAHRELPAAVKANADSLAAHSRRMDVIERQRESDHQVLLDVRCYVRSLAGVAGASLDDCVLGRSDVPGR